MISCPDCAGTGKTIASHVRMADGTGRHNVPMRCSRCAGSGEVDDRTLEWIEVGNRMRETRLAARRNLAEEAKRRGLPVAKLSAMEFGKIEPILEDVK